MSRDIKRYLTFPATVRDDWATRASGAAGWFVVPSTVLEPAPPVLVIEPEDSKPFAPMGKATTALLLSLDKKYKAFGGLFGCELEAPWGAGIAMARRLNDATRTIIL
jgi:hypothetical protein